VIGEVTISRATGNNAKFVVDNGIGPGAEVEIIRSGDVIPKIHAVLQPVPSEYLQLPEVDYQWNESGVEMVTTDSTSVDQQASVLLSFVTTIKVKQLSRATVKNLVKDGVITPEQLLGLSEEALASLPKMGKTSAQTVLTNLRGAMAKVSPEQLMTSSNCFPNIGMVRLEAITSHFEDTLLEHGPEVDYRTTPGIISETDIIGIPGFKQSLAHGIIVGLDKFHQFLEESPKFNEYFKDSLDRYYQVLYEGPSQEVESTPFTGVVFTFTGFRDASLKTQLESMGATVLDTFSASKTQILVKKGPGPASAKESTALKRGITVWTKPHLLEQLSQV
jgi:NAD-dependent DNA ligase